MATIHKSDDGGLVHQHYQKALELEKHLLASMQSKGTFDPNVRSLRSKIRELYESIILEDHEFAESHEVEQLLWRLHHTRIDDFRARIRKSKVATGLGKGGAVGRRESVQNILAVFRSFLAEATGFYHDLMLKIRAKHGLPQDDSSNCSIEVSGVKNDESRLAEIRRCQMSCHRCMIYLGDLARYKEYYNELDGANHDWSIAAGFYAKAISLSRASGNPHNQLAVLATYVGDELLAVYHYFHSLFAEFPFLTAKDNLIVLFEKNRNSYLQLAASICDNFPYPFKGGIGEPAVDASTNKRKSKGDKRVGSGKSHAKALQSESDESLESTIVVALSHTEVLKSLQVCFVRLNGILFTRTSLETFAKVQSHVLTNLKQLMQLHSKGGDTDRSSNVSTAGGLWGSGPSTVLQLVSILICSVHNSNYNSESNQPSHAEILQRSVILEHAFLALFDCMGSIVEHCVDADEVAVAFFLPSVLVIVEWLSCRPEMALGTEVKEKEKNSRMFFWRTCAKLLNRLWKGKGRSDVRDVTGTMLGSIPFKSSKIALWEDYELQGFMPLQPIHAALDFTTKPTVGIGGRNEMQARIHRIVRAGKILSSTLGKESGIHFDHETNTFYHGEDKKGVGDSKAVPDELNGSLKATPLPEETGEQRVERQVKSIEECSLPKIPSGDEEDEVIVFRPSVSKLKDIELENNNAIVGRTAQQFREEQTSPFQLQPLNSTSDCKSNIDVTMSSSTLPHNTENRLYLPDGVSATSLVSCSLPILPQVALQINTFKPTLPGNRAVAPADLGSHKSESTANIISAHDVGSIHSTLPLRFEPLMNSEIGLKVVNDKGIMSSGSATGWANSGTLGNVQNLRIPVDGTSFPWLGGTQFGMFQNQQPWVSKSSWPRQTGDSFWSPELQSLNAVAKSKVISSSDALTGGAGNGVTFMQSFAPKLPYNSPDLFPVRIPEAANILPNSLLNDLQVGPASIVHDIESSLPGCNATSETFKVVCNEAAEMKETLLSTSSITLENYGFGSSFDGKKTGWKTASVAGMRPPPGFAPLPGLKAPEASKNLTTPVSTDLLVAGTSGSLNVSLDGSFQPIIYDDYTWLDGYTPSGASQQTAVRSKPGSRMYPSLESDITSPFPGMKFPDYTRSSSSATAMQQENSMAHLQQELAIFHLEHQLQQAQQHASAPFLAQIDQQLPDPSWSPSPLQALASQQQQLHHPPWPPTDLFMS